MVVLGTPTADSSKLFAITVTAGDPTWAGPLAGEALALPVFHITETEIKEQVNDSLYEEEVGLVEMVLETDAIIAAVKKVRNGGGAA